MALQFPISKAINFSGFVKTDDSADPKFKRKRIGHLLTVVTMMPKLLVLFLGRVKWKKIIKNIEIDPQKSKP